MPGALKPQPNGNQNKPRDIDIVLLHDATGSQQPYINAARKTAREYVEKIAKGARLKGGSARYRVVAFRDHREQGDAWIVHDSNPFVTDGAALEKQLNNIVASGGGDGPEAQIDAFDAVLRSSWRDPVQKIVLLFTDSPPHGIGEPGDRIPASHPDALTAQSILDSYMNGDIQLIVFGCIPTIRNYKKAEEFYLNFTKKTAGVYLTLDRSANAAVLSRGVVGSVLHASDSLRLADTYGAWIMDASDHGHDALVDALHSKLTADGEECHEVVCTEHGGHDIQYHLAPVSRARVDTIVGKTLAYKEMVKSDPVLNAIFG
ncbi:hypothetical protein B0H14DRAFT_3858029 [Mycena olivaceomarginata]|nr:hypothetical protein B0H14DRAFT_3858029 [Mycena olivaceomarginata]